MCGRYILSDISRFGYREMLRIIEPEEPHAAPSWNIAPTQTAPIVIAEEGSTREVRARWGLVPKWHRGAPKDLKYPTFNARIETATQKPAFCASWRSSRCLVQTGGYYEWTGPKGSKQPWFITLEHNRTIFWFAGLYSKRADGISFTILTRSADRVLEGLHHRMPVILRDDQLEVWLNGEDDDETIIASLGAGFGPRLRWHRVDPVRGDGAHLIEPLQPLV